MGLHFSTLCGIPTMGYDQPKEEDIGKVVQKADSGTRFRFPSSERRRISFSAKEDQLSETDNIIEQLQIQLSREEEMAQEEDMEELEKEYLQSLDSPAIRLQYAYRLVQRNEISYRRKGLRILYSLYREEKGNAEPSNLFRTILYYLVVANYRLTFYQEATRFVNEILSVEPSNRQAMRFSLLLNRAMRKSYLILLDRACESAVAFDKILSLLNPDDVLILVTIFEESELDRTLREQGIEPSQPAYPSMKESRVNQMAEAIQKKYRLICDERGIQYNYICEVGDPRKDVCEIIDQEQVDVCVITHSPSEKSGLFSRVRLSNLSEYLYHNASCDVLLVKGFDIEDTEEES